MRIRYLAHSAGRCLYLIVLLPVLVGAEPRPLGELLRDWSRQLDRNFVLDERLSLDTPIDLPSKPEGLDQLDAWLAGSGLKQVELDNGDRLITANRELSLKMSALSVQDTALSDPTIATGLVDRTASTTRVDGAEIEASTDRELDHLFLRVGNVFGSRDGFFIRGIPRSGDLNTLGNASVFVDGNPLPPGVLANVPVSTWDTAAIRFRRGADSEGGQGPFAAYAGAVELDYGLPGFSPGGRWATRYTDRGDIQAAASYDTVFVADELAMRSSIDYQSLTGTLDASDGSRRDLDDADSLTGRLAWRWEPVSVSGLSAHLSASWIDASSGPQTLLQPADSASPFDRQGGFVPIRKSDVQFGAVSFAAEFESNDGRAWSLQGGASRATIELEPTRPLANEILPRFELVERTGTDTQFLDLSHEMPIAGGGAWTLAVSAGRTKAKEQVDRDRALWTINNSLDRWSIRSGVEIPLGLGFRSQARLRFDHDELNKGCHVMGNPGAGFAESEALTCTRLLGFYAALNDDSRLPPLRRSFSEVSPEWALSRTLNDDQEVFVRWYRGYNAGGAASSVTLSGRPFWVVYEPEQSSNAELGWSLDRDRFRTRVTAFYGSLDRQWMPVLGGSDFPLDEVTNSGKSRHYGIEWDARMQVGDRHHLQLSMGWLRTRFINHLPFERDVELVPASGNEFPGAPEYSGSLAWRFDFRDPWRFTAVTSYHADTFANANNTELARVPASTLVDVGLEYRWRSLTVRAEIRNLLDEDYLETTPRIIRNTNLIEYAPGIPRTSGLKIAYSF